MNFQEWVEKYKPLGTKDEKPYALETYGAELSMVNKNDPHYIWTLCEGDEGQIFIGTGKRFVNRLNYFVCRVPWEEYEEVNIDDWADLEVYFGM